MTADLVWVRRDHVVRYGEIGQGHPHVHGEPMLVVDLGHHDNQVDIAVGPIGAGREGTEQDDLERIESLTRRSSRSGTHSARVRPLCRPSLKNRSISPFTLEDEDVED
jgi:hypothetical protein